MTTDHESSSDLRYLMQDHFVRYASYVILDRAIPHVIDGLKPVQRRILHTLWKMHDGKFHKVANVAGQTMAYHPHGDAPITDALVNLANKGFLLAQQGNFGNLLTGDPAAASRYIETRLAELAVETMFNNDITATVPSYDGRNQEPVTLPSKIPVLLMQGADGIAVGMSTRILPHNFVELLEAEIAAIEGKPFALVPDFQTGGLMDASDYDKGKGKVKLRAHVEIKDPKTLVIREICYGTTTESLIRSIDEAAKKGKIKIDAINDYTADRVEIEIRLPRGQYAQEIIDALYAFTECEVSLHSQIVVIKDDMPWETTVDEIIYYQAEKLQEYLKKELEIEEGRILERIFDKTLEQIFIENRLYKPIEKVNSQEKIHEVVAEGLKPFHKQLVRIPTEADREKLLNIPIRRISQFDISKNENDIRALSGNLEEVQKDLKQVKKVAVRYLKELLKKYGKSYPRRTRLQEIEIIDKRAISTKTLKVGFDPSSGFVGTKVRSDHEFECTNFDKLLVLFKDGRYKVSNIPEKEYLKEVAYVGVADKKTIFNIAYKETKTHIAYAKRFIVKQFILDKEYTFIDEGTSLEYLSTEQNPVLDVQLKPAERQKISALIFPFKDVLVKGVSAKGVRISPRPVKKVVRHEEGKKRSPQMDLFK